MLSQLLWLFGFFALVLVAVFWINRAVSLFDRLIGDGQTALVFLEFTALGLPRLIVTVLPLATFAAAVYLTNRMSNESELTIMLATGSGPWRLARPVFVFGLIVALLMSALVHLLVPLARAQLSEREAEISRNVTSRLLTEGTFLSPTEGVTFYTREISDEGVLLDVFLSDRRAPDARMTYTAAEAYLLRGEEDRANLIMLDGLAQRLTPDQRLSTAKFSDFTFDITTLVRRDRIVSEKVEHVTTRRLLRDRAEATGATRASAAEITQTIHARMAQPIFCIVAALVGFSMVLAGGYSRFGVWREIAAAFGILLVLDGLRTVVSDVVIDNQETWPLMYLPGALGFLTVAIALTISANPGRLTFRRLRGAAS